MSGYYIKEGDLSPAFSGFAKDRDGEAVDLTLATGVTFRFTKPDGTAMEGTAAIIDAATGELSYQWALGDTDVPGTGTGEFVVTFPTDLPQTFPSKGYAVFNIERKIS